MIDNFNNAILARDDELNQCVIDAESCIIAKDDVVHGVHGDTESAKWFNRGVKAVIKAMKSRKRKGSQQ